MGPNDFERLSAFDNDLEDIVPFGSSIFGTINRWIIRPMFSFLSSFIGSKGLVIIVLTVIVKLALYPLTYKMLAFSNEDGSIKTRNGEGEGQIQGRPVKAANGDNENVS